MTEAGEKSRPKMPESVLIVDDDENVLDAYRRRLTRVLDVHICDDPVQALLKVKRGKPFAVIISDYMMPKMNGVEFLAQCMEHAPQSVRMMLTGVSDFQAAIDAVNSGSVFRFLMKPCPPEVMGQALVDGISQYRLVRAQDELVNDTLGGAVQLVSDIVAATTPGPASYATFLKPYVGKVAARLEAENTRQIETAWLLCMADASLVPRSVLSEAGRDGATSENPLGSAVQLGEAVSAIARLDEIGEFIRLSTKGYDGSGMPERGGQGDRIPLGARILAVFRGVAQLLSTGLPLDQTTPALRENDGRYDPRVLNALNSAFENDQLSAELVEIAVEPEELQPGDILADEIQTPDRDRVLGAGAVLNPFLIARIRNHATTTGLDSAIRVRRSGAVVDLTADA